VFADNGSGIDDDVDGDAFNVSEVDGVTGNVGTQFALASGALLTLNANGTFAYDPNGQFEALGVGQTGTDTFDYTIDDGNGGTNMATATVSITGLNDAPVAEDDAVTTNEDTILNGDVFADNGSGIDDDIDGDAINVILVNGVTNVGTQFALASGALLTLNANGTFAYDPNGQFEALGIGQTATETFDYTIDDGNGGTDTATATVSITGVNDAPVAADDAFSIDQDGMLIENVFADNGGGVDADIDGDVFTVTQVEGSAANVGNLITLAFGTVLTLNADGTFAYGDPGAFTFLPDGAVFNDSFTYTIDDGNGGTDTATATVPLPASMMRRLPRMTRSPPMKTPFSMAMCLLLTAAAAMMMLTGMRLTSRKLTALPAMWAPSLHWLPALCSPSMAMAPLPMIPTASLKPSASAKPPPRPSIIR